MPRVAINNCVGAVLVLFGAYGLLMGFVSASYELGQAWGGATAWLLDLVQGILRPLPAALTLTWVEAEFTCVLTSLVPLVLLGLGAWLCQDAIMFWGARARALRAARRAQGKK